MKKNSTLEYCEQVLRGNKSPFRPIHIRQWFIKTYGKDIISVLILSIAVCAMFYMLRLLTFRQIGEFLSLVYLGGVTLAVWCGVVVLKKVIKYTYAKYQCKRFETTTQYAEIKRMELAIKLMGETEVVADLIRLSEIKLVKHPSLKLWLYRTSGNGHEVYIAPTLLDNVGYHRQRSQHLYRVRSQNGYADMIEHMNSVSI